MSIFTQHNVLYKAAEQFTNEHKLDEPSLARGNQTQYETPKDRLCDIYFEILDAVIAEIKHRLGDDSLDLLKTMSKVI